MELVVHGDPEALLQRLAALPVADLVYPPADLKSVFLDYYERAAPGLSLVFYLAWVISRMNVG